MNEKIHIIGIGGSGKSFLGNKISRKLACPILELDRIFWDKNALEYGIKAPKEERMQDLQEFMQNESYVIEGVYYNWLDDAFSKADKIILLDVSICLATYRILKRFTKQKLGFSKNCYAKKETLKSLYKLISWNFKYQKNELPLIYEKLRPYKNKLIICKNSSDVDKLFN